MDILKWAKGGVLLFDGAMGTVLQQRGLPPGALPELVSLADPGAVTGIHREYLLAGADVATANTFQAHELKLPTGHSVEDVVSAAVGCARKAGARAVALDVGPLGQLLEPLGQVSFGRAYEVFRRQMIAGEKAGADIIIIETISDLYEAKAAILAAKENTRLPVFCTMTFQDDGRSFLGCDPVTAAVALQGFGADAIGVNCSLGPEKLIPIVKTMLEYSRVPVIAQANAGLPAYRGGHAVYDMPVESYADAAMEMVRLGAAAVGGCCGTTPEHIRVISGRLCGEKPAPRAPRRVTACTSGIRTVILDGAVTEIGERLNPTGKKKLQAALRAGDYGYLAGEALSQTKAGAGVLDVNVGLPDIDEPSVLARAVREVQAVTSAPLQIDSADPGAIEAALRVYNGKPIINSVNGKPGVMERVFPLAKKYGALVVGLTLDENGIPPTAQGRLEIARRMLAAAESYGIAAEDLLIDCLVLTASAQQAQVGETLAAIRLVKAELGLKTVLGVSNVSFGLPCRELINATFLASALGAGLDAAIINPMSARYRETLNAFRVLNNEDRNASGFVAKYSAEAQKPQAKAEAALSLSEIIEQGRKDEAGGAVRKLLETGGTGAGAAMGIVDREFIPALGRVGKRFETGEIFLPQLMMSAQAVQNGFAVIREHMGTRGERCEPKGRILMATVEGDIHDIGKNIVSLILESYGYEIIDLGKDVPVQAVVDAIRENGIRLAGLSALMTTTIKSMKDTIEAAAGLGCAFFVGGAALSEEYARFAGADYYAKDAMEGVAIANRFFGFG